MGFIGKVSVSERNPSTCDEFCFWLHREERIRPFDIIKVQHLDNSVTFATVQEIFHATDSSGHLTNYISSDFGDVESTPETLRLGMTYVQARVLSNSKGIDMPVRSGALVDFATEDDVRTALGLGDLEKEIPGGFIQMSNGTTVPIGYNKEFLLGPDGAHLNITGISGLATKTSYAMFLLQAIQQRCDNVAIIIINVKGRDLLQIDEHNPDLTSQQKEEWGKCNLECKPFERVKYFYPFLNKQNRFYSSTNCRKSSLEKQHDENRAFNFIYDYEEHKEKMNLLFSNIDDPNLTWESIMSKFLDDKSFEHISSWNEFLNEVNERAKAGSSKKDEVPVVSWKKFNRIVKTYIKPYLNNSIFQKGKSNDCKLKHVYLSENIKEIKAGDVYVIDIELVKNLQHQFLVIGDVFKSVRDIVMNEKLDKVVVFFDELNKYAPKDGPKNSPILLDILDVAERGRSSGIILFSAQQFKSAVHDRVHGNCSTHVFGRTNAIEVSKPAYKFVPKTYQSTMTRLSTGELIVEHPIFRSLLRIHFPYPSYDQDTSKG